jgi:Leucine-rich repeat (LRR) protein
MSARALDVIKECIDKKNPILNLAGCGLTDEDFETGSVVYIALKKCNHIHTLSLASNKVSRISQLINLIFVPFLIELSLYNNEISSLEGIEKFINLKKLYLHKNAIDFLLGITTLTKLEELALSSNKLTSVAGIKRLEKLQKLYLHDNAIVDVTAVENLISLNLLTINNNQISDLRPVISLVKKKKNTLSIICNGLWNTDNDEINVDNNPLVYPPIEIARQGNTAIFNYFTSIEEQGIVFLYEAKVLILGQPRAGKTSFCQKMININNSLPTEDTTTRGIDIDRLHFDIIDNEGNKQIFYYNIWDFGGQQIYQTTHQFFLTHRSLYILVVDTGKDSIGNDDSNINYWLQVVELLGGNSSLMVVRNEKNERQIRIDINQKKARFNFIKGDYHIDLNALSRDEDSFDKKKLDDFITLKDDIQEELKRLPLAGYPMPKNWVLIRNQLYTLSLTQDFINLNQYIEICVKYDVVAYEAQMSLSKIFHDLGIFLHFQDYATLEDFIILKNTWATDAVFSVLDNVPIQKRNGKFTDADLKLIWKGKSYEASVHKKLLALMMQFELCYQLDGIKPNTYIMPEMLPDQAPKGYLWTQNDDLLVEYWYDFMPKGILTKLIVRLNKYIVQNDEVQMVWKSGLRIDGKALSCPNTYAEVIEAWDNKKLQVRIQGEFSTKLKDMITFQIDTLNNEFFQTDQNETTLKSKWYKMVPCTCSTCILTSDKHFFDHAFLLDRLSFGKEKIECVKRPYTTLKIKSILDGVSEPFATELIENPDKRNLQEIKQELQYDNKSKLVDVKEIKLFLASSSELESTREKFEIFIYRETKRFHKKNMFLDLFVWKDAPDNMSKTRLQDKYNEVIKVGDIFVLLFFSKVVKYTLEEFEVAYKHFMETGKPHIFVYFKKDSLTSTAINKEDMLSVFKFKERLEELGHFYTVFENDTDLHLHFKKQLEKLYDL